MRLAQKIGVGSQYFAFFVLRVVVVALYMEGAFISSFVSLNLFSCRLICICGEQVYSVIHF